MSRPLEVTIDVTSVMAGAARRSSSMPDATRSSSMHNATEEPAAARPCVLAIDEPGPNLTRVSVALRDDGYDVIVATSERDVEGLLRTRAVDCIVLPFESVEH